MQVNVAVEQTGTITSKGLIRTHEVVIDRPESKNGTNLGPMGGELMLTSLGGCFISNVLEAIRVREAAISDVKLTVTGTVAGTPGRFTAIHMDVSGNAEDQAEFEKLVTIAERSCLVANTMKEAVDLTIAVK